MSICTDNYLTHLFENATFAFYQLKNIEERWNEKQIMNNIISDSTKLLFDIMCHFMYYPFFKKTKF